MKLREITNYIIIGLSIVSLGYVIYVQSKQGIQVYGSENVIDPFQYETGVFQNRYSGLDPMSSAHHITESELQSRKLKKMSGLLIFTIPIILILLFVNNRKDEKSGIEESETLPEKKIEPSLQNSITSTSKNVEEKNEVVKNESFSFLYISSGLLIVIFVLFLITEKNKKQNFETSTLTQPIETQIDSSKTLDEEVTADEVPTDAEANSIDNKVIEEEIIDYTDKDALNFLEDYYSFDRRNFVFRNAKFRKIENNRFEISVEESVNKELFIKTNFHWHAVLYDLQINNGKYSISELVR